MQKYLLAIQGLRRDPLVGYITRDCLYTNGSCFIRNLSPQL